MSWLLAGAVGLVAVALRAGPVLSGAGLTALYRYDSGVYFAAAVALHEGFVPYRDFLLLHPPGILLALAPFAALASSLGDQGAMVAARVSFMVLGGLTAALICHLLRSYGWVAALIGGLFYAGYGPAVYVERSTGLEALASFLTVAGLCLLMPGLRGRRRVGWLVAAGAMLGLTVTVKIWGVVTVLTVLVWLLVGRRVRAALWVGAGAAASSVLVLLPFFLVAPDAMWRMLVLDQVGRPRSGQTLVARMYDVVGLVELRTDQWTIALVAALAVLVAALVVALMDDLGRLACIGVAVGLLVLLNGPSWFRGYPVLIAPFLALGVGVASGVLREHLPRAGWIAVASGFLLATTAAGALQLRDDISQPFDGRELARIASERPGCVTVDDPSALIASGLLSRNLANGCPVVVDLSGYQYHVAEGGPVGTGNAAWQRFTLDYLGSGKSTLLLRSTIRGWLSADSLATIKSWPVIGRVSGANVREPVR